MGWTNTWTAIKYNQTLNTKFIVKKSKWKSHRGRSMFGVYVNSMPSIMSSKREGMPYRNFIIKGNVGGEHNSHIDLIYSCYLFEHSRKIILFLWVL